MRTLAVAALTGFVALAVASAASAAPSYSLIWTGTTGSGTTGSSSIDATAGDTLTLDVLFSSDVQFLAVDFGLFGTGVTGVSGTECPSGASSGSSNNVIPGACVTTTFQLLQPIQPGVTVSGSNIQFFDAASLSAVNPLAQPLWVGRAVFTVTGPGSVNLDQNGLSGTGALPGGGTFYATASATIVPEPGTVGLMGLGLAALGLAGRRRK